MRPNLPSESETVERSKAIRIIKLLISACFFVGTTAWNVLTQIAGQKPKGRCVILYYHCILPQHRGRFATQMDILLRKTIPVPVDHRQRLEECKYYSSVTFDDGFASVAEQALPELVKRHIPVTIFVASDLIGQSPMWKGYPGTLMSLNQLRGLPTDLISLGSHTKTHPCLTAIPEEQARREIALSRVKLEQLFGREFTLFAFPYGAFNESLIEICREAGYQRVFTTLPYLAQLGLDQFVCGRVAVEPTDWRVEFCLKLSGSYRWLPIAISFKGKLKAMFAAERAVGAAIDGRLSHDGVSGSTQS